MARSPADLDDIRDAVEIAESVGFMSRNASGTGARAGRRSPLRPREPEPELSPEDLATFAGLRGFDSEPVATRCRGGSRCPCRALAGLSAEPVDGVDVAA